MSVNTNKKMGIPVHMKAKPIIIVVSIGSWIRGDSNDNRRLPMH